MSFPRYPAYKDSGVKWMGEVPEHWEVDRLKYIAKASPSNVDKKSYEGDHAVLLCNYTDVYYNEEIVAGMSFMAATATTDQVEKFTLREGDTIITKDSETADDIAISAYVPQSLPGVVCGYHLSLIRPREGIDGRFIKRLFDSHFARATLGIAANGLTRYGLSQYPLDNFELPLPPAGEQTAIATFLDCETAKIDALVSDYRTLIELLQEKRQAVISHAVTKGLDSTVPMKDSGVEWLGEVPEQWDVVRLAEILREANDTGDEDLPILTVSIHHGVSDKEYDESELERKVSRSDDRSKYKTVRPGDLVYNMMRAWQGGFGAVIVDGLVSPAYVVARPIRQINTSFVEQVLRCPTAVEEMRRRSHGVTDFRLRLYWQEFKDIRIAIPPLEEQTKTMRLVERQTEKFDHLVTDAQEAITLLQERRTALISAAVTGKIDVRGLVATEEA